MAKSSRMGARCRVFWCWANADWEFRQRDRLLPYLLAMVRYGIRTILVGQAADRLGEPGFSKTGMKYDAAATEPEGR